jgi:imidazolonepropionase-like amidohydrolase
MAATKSLLTIIAAGTSVATSGTATGTTIDLTTKYGALITGLITNGGTGPTTQAVAYVEVSGDGTNWKQLAMFLGGVNASTVTPFACRVPPEVMNARVRVTGNTGQAVTCEAFAQILVTI